MEQKAKRKHPNFFDILFILLILAVAAAAYLLSHQTPTTQDTTVRTYKIELDHLQTSMADCVAVGDTVTDTVRNLDMGTVTAVEVLPYTAAVSDEDANVVRQVPVEGYVTLWLTVEAETLETDTAIVTESGYTLRTGVSISCAVGTLVGSGYVLGIER